MPWEFRWEGASVRVDELPITVVEEAAAEGGVKWFDLLDAPLRNATAGLALAKRCAQAAGVDIPDGISARKFLDLFELVADDLPVEYRDGAPVPKADAS